MRLFRWAALALSLMFAAPQPSFAQAGEPNPAWAVAVLAAETAEALTEWNYEQQAVSPKKAIYSAGLDFLSMPETTNNFTTTDFSKGILSVWIAPPPGGTFVQQEPPIFSVNMPYALSNLNNCHAGVTPSAMEFDAGGGGPNTISAMDFGYWDALVNNSCWPQYWYSYVSNRGSGVANLQGWTNVLATWNWATLKNQIYLNDTLIGNCIGCYTSAPPTPMIPRNVIEFLGSASGSGSMTAGAFAELWMNFGMETDFSVASNRAYFHNQGPSGKYYAVALGTYPPFGVKSPTFYFSALPGANYFGQCNRGNGGSPKWVNGGLSVFPTPGPNAVGIGVNNPDYIPGFPPPQSGPWPVLTMPTSFSAACS